MSQLLLAKDLRNSDEGSEVRTLARASTLTVLGRLDCGRKGRLLRFLYEADLINKDKPVIELTGVDASDADLSGAILGGADLRGADLGGAELSGAVLVEADLSCAPRGYGWMERSRSCIDLSGADLGGAILNHTNLACAPAAVWWVYNEINRTDCVDLRNANLVEKRSWIVVYACVQKGPTTPPIFWTLNAWFRGVRKAYELNLPRE